MRTRNEFWIGLFLISALVTGCGQNPHIVGPDPSVAGPVTSPGDNQNNGNGGGGKKGEPKEELPCIRTTVAYFTARALRADEQGTKPSGSVSQATSVFATDVNLPAFDTVKELKSVKMRFAQPGSSRGQPGEEICLLNLDSCAIAKDHSLEDLDLAVAFRDKDWLKVLYGSPTLRWSVPLAWGSTEALLQVELITDHCNKKPDDGGTEPGA